LTASETADFVSLVLRRPSPPTFFWVLLCMGAWHVILVSDPSAMPPSLETAFEHFLPVLFVGDAFWRYCWRWVTPAFENAGYILERTVWYLAGFWFGLLINVRPRALSRPPSQLSSRTSKLTPSACRSRSTGSRSTVSRRTTSSSAQAAS